MATIPANHPFAAVIDRLEASWKKGITKSSDFFPNFLTMAGFRHPMDPARRPAKAAATAANAPAEERPAETAEEAAARVRENLEAAVDAAPVTTPAEREAFAVVVGQLADVVAATAANDAEAPAVAPKPKKPLKKAVAPAATPASAPEANGAEKPKAGAKKGKAPAKAEPAPAPAVPAKGGKTTKVEAKPREPNALRKGQIAVLQALAKHGGKMTSKELVEASGIDGSAVGYLVGYKEVEINSRPVHAGNLVNRGLVNGKYFDEDGKNVFRYSITAAGRKIADKMAK